ncbi:adhesive plaque matrix protein 2-like isoform X2 [Haliotis rufescens]|uniref:adhesive plaque matrix protein 2-like isoform X2 n=1 Tax=Haliotis rufescens TaxID=6454 RepID=UPI00201FA5A3|nr:adhesive plaque matrix protein 2-like isoform X2 [Haliotis rufescens]
MPYRKRPTQCTNCMLYGHTKTSCNQPPKCRRKVGVGRCHKRRCRNGGTCKQIGPSKWKCLCRRGFRGRRCRRKVGVGRCHKRRCRNGCTCKQIGPSKWKCLCRRGFRGRRFRRKAGTKKRPCRRRRCYNGGTCTRRRIIKKFKRRGRTGWRVRWTWSCKCRRGFKGRNCRKRTRTKKSPCRRRRCYNGATCTRHKTIKIYRWRGRTRRRVRWTWSCKCRRGFKGRNCRKRTRTKKRPCRRRRCYNGATCTLHKTLKTFRWRGRTGRRVRWTWSCKCRRGFKGRNCRKRTRTKKRPCRRRRCYNGATCTLHKTLKTFRWRGRTGRRVRWTWSCKCRRGFKGRNCRKRTRK